MKYSTIMPILGAACLSLTSTSSFALTEAEVAAAGGAQFGDLQAFNWRILNQVDGTAIPSTPTGNQTGFIRMFSNGNTHNPAGATSGIVWNPENSGTLANTFNYNQTAAQWWGLEIDKQDGVSAVQSVNDLIGFLETTNGLGATDPVSPIFGFDQNQQTSSPDIYLRARLLILDAPASDLLGLDAAGVDAYFADPLNASKITIFNMLDDAAFPDFTGDDGLPVGASNHFDDWVLLQGNFDPDGDPTPGVGPFDPVSNNGSGNNADWGGYIIDPYLSKTFDLRDYADRLLFVELQALLDNNGKEEAYILGVLNTPELPDPDPEDPQDPTGAVPEPMTMLTGLMALAGLSLATRRRGQRS